MQYKILSWVWEQWEKLRYIFKNIDMFSGWIEDIQWRPMFEKTMCFTQDSFLCWVMHLMWGPQTVKERAV